MIKSFRCKDTRSLYEGGKVIRFRAFKEQAERRLDRLDQALELRDLAALRGNRLEALRGDRQGRYGIRINDQWRICFRWKDGNAYDVEIVDYH